jgi:hypothetical protein
MKLFVKNLASGDLSPDPRWKMVQEIPNYLVTGPIQDFDSLPRN